PRRRGPADPPAPHPERGDRRGASRAGRQAAARTRLRSRASSRSTIFEESYEMPVSVTMPRLGESVTEGTVTRWLKQEGERVEADEPLLEVSTDKVDTEIPSPAAGALSRIVVHEDETAEVGIELAVIDGRAGRRAGEGTGAGAGEGPPGGRAAGGPGRATRAAPGAGRAERRRRRLRDPAGAEAGHRAPGRPDQAARYRRGRPDPQAGRTGGGRA